MLKPLLQKELLFVTRIILFFLVWHVKAILKLTTTTTTTTTTKEIRDKARRFA
jgi:hypothetical protein